MMKSRTRQRENRRVKHREELLDKHSIYGFKDLTPYNVVLQIVSGKEAPIVLR